MLPMVAKAYPRASSWNALNPDEFRPRQYGTLSEMINRRYDSTMYSRFVDAYYDHSGFHNYGYWTPETLKQREASEKLVDVLEGFFPHKEGNVLDVACGKGRRPSDSCVITILRALPGSTSLKSNWPPAAKRLQGAGLSIWTQRS
jgi:hypothetical protein